MMRICGSIEDSEKSLNEIRKKLQWFTEETMIAAIEEDYRFSFDKIQRNVIELFTVQNLAELLQIGNEPVEFQVLGEEFVVEKYTDNGTIHIHYRKWENPSIEESEKILAKNDMSEVFKNSSPIGKEILKVL